MPHTFIDTILDSFIQEGKNCGLEFKEVDPTSPQDIGNKDFICVEIPNHKLQATNLPKKFPIQIGRQVITKLLKTPEKIDWKKCVVNTIQEKKEAKDFVEKFRDFDTNMQK